MQDNDINLSGKQGLNFSFFALHAALVLRANELSKNVNIYSEACNAQSNPDKKPRIEITQPSAHTIDTFNRIKSNLNYFKNFFDLHVQSEDLIKSGAKMPEYTDVGLSIGGQEPSAAVYAGNQPKVALTLEKTHYKPQTDKPVPPETNLTRQMEDLYQKLMPKLAISSQNTISIADINKCMRLLKSITQSYDIKDIRTDFSSSAHSFYQLFNTYDLRKITQTSFNECIQRIGKLPGNEELIRQFVGAFEICKSRNSCLFNISTDVTIMSTQPSNITKTSYTPEQLEPKINNAISLLKFLDGYDPCEYSTQKLQDFNQMLGFHQDQKTTKRDIEMDNIQTLKAYINQMPNRDDLNANLRDAINSIVFNKNRRTSFIFLSLSLEINFII